MRTLLEIGDDCNVKRDSLSIIQTKYDRIPDGTSDINIESELAIARKAFDDVHDELHQYYMRNNTFK